jgi:hypothetical protein
MAATAVIEDLADTNHASKLYLTAAQKCTRHKEQHVPTLAVTRKLLLEIELWVAWFL